MRQETKAAGAANSHLAAAFQVPSGAVVSPRMRRGRGAHRPSSPSARRSGNQRPRNALSRPEPPFGLSPVLPEALPPPGDPTRSVGSGRAPTRPWCALRSVACAPGARALRPRHLPPRASPRRPAPPASRALRPSLSTSFFALSPPLLLFLSSSSRHFFYLVFFQKQTQGAPSGRRVSPGELFLCLVVAVVAAAPAPPPSSRAPPPPRETSAQ